MKWWRTQSPKKKRQKGTNMLNDRFLGGSSAVVQMKAAAAVPLGEEVKVEERENWWIKRGNKV